MNYISNAISTVSNGAIARAIKVIEIIPDTLNCVGLASEALIGIVATPFSAITCGKIKKLNKQAKLTFNAKLILPQIFKSLMSIINPNAKYDDKELQAVISEIVTEIFDKKFNELKNSPSLINRQIVLRALILAEIPLSVISRSADTLLAVPIVMASLVTLGTVSKINGLAIRHLKAPLSIINDLSIVLRCLLNPYIT